MRERVNVLRKFKGAVAAILIGISVPVISACSFDMVPGEIFPTITPTSITEPSPSRPDNTEPAPLDESSLAVEPTETTLPTDETEPTEAPVVQIVITKNPGSESVYEGAKVWFIAHADNADKIKWEFCDPEGEIVSVADTISRNPGLEIEILELDTIALRSIPATLDGWSIRAEFSNDSCSVFTAYADIHVRQFVDLYSDVLDRYRAAVTHGITDLGVTMEYGISELAYDYFGGTKYFCYALIDLDNNGIQELLIYSCLDGTTARINEIYTLVKDSPVRIAIAGGRHGLYLMPDKKIFSAASGGAAYAIDYLYRVEGSRMIVVDGIRSREGVVQEEIEWFHTMDEDPDLDHAERISREDALNLIDAWFDGAIVPELDRFA